EIEAAIDLVDGAEAGGLAEDVAALEFGGFDIGQVEGGALPGDRFIIRMFSPVVTIGGGVVIDTAARRYRKSDNVKARLDTLSGDDPAARIALLVREAEFGIAIDDLVARTGMSEPAIVAAAAKAPVAAIPQPRPWYIDRAWMQSARERIVKTVREFHQKHPLLPGIARQELRAGAPPWVLDILLADSKDVVADAELVRSRSHKLVLKEDEEQARAKIVLAFQESGLAVPALPEVLAKSGVEPARARSLLQILLREKILVRISEDLVFHASALDQLRALLAAHKGERFAVPAFKEWTGISRKYAIPLLEFLDREKLTRRDADHRVIL
ncbi:MAG TPA: SelB C-terminal domain-containing protein, partial [Candidatus Solibacter sp.]